jgi:hypothetical protein
MPSTCEPQPTRALTPAELVNEEIRAYMRARTGRPLHTDEAEEYRRLLERWWAAPNSSRPRRAPGMTKAPRPVPKDQTGRSFKTGL